ncbi:MAG: hypothetical protein LBG83_09405 [Oscillospiraceae bacterium]|jgi:hypothetical protein|nr:hypothetical protein [Oscillospiraceae bacterium]
MEDGEAHFSVTSRHNTHAIPASLLRRFVPIVRNFGMANRFFAPLKSQIPVFRNFGILQITAADAKNIHKAGGELSLRYAAKQWQIATAVA